MTDERLHLIQYIRNNNKRFLVIALSSTETHITTGSHERGNKKKLIERAHNQCNDSCQISGAQVTIQDPTSNVVLNFEKCCPIAYLPFKRISINL